MQNFMGMDGFIWFTGVVEDRNDPSKLGRVRVRCVGHHTDDKSKIPTADLPWAHVMHPVTDPSMNGMGNTPSFMVEGTWVVGFFMDAEDKQQPVIIGTLPGVPDESPDKSKGFNDPTGTYPKSDFLDESDVNRLARADKENVHTMITSKEEIAKNFRDIETAQSQNFQMPFENSLTTTRYPYNHVYESESGHVREYDDTYEEERISEYHKEGTFYEITAGGDKIVHVIGDNYEFTAGNNFINVVGDVNLTVDGNMETLVKKDYNIRCKNLNIEVEEDFDTIVRGDTTQQYGYGPSTLNPDKPGILKTTALGAVSERYDTTFDGVYKGNATHTYGDKLDSSIKGAVTERYGSTIDRRIDGIQTEIFASTVNLTTEGSFNIDSEISFNVNAVTVDLDGTTVDIDGTTISANSTTSNINASSTINLNGTTTKINANTAFDVDATAITFDSSSTNIAPTGGGHGTSPSTSAGSGASVESPDTPESELNITEINDVPVEQRVQNQSSDRTDKAGTGGYNPNEQGDFSVVAPQEVASASERTTKVDGVGIDTSVMSVSQVHQAHKDVFTSKKEDYKPELKGTEEGKKLSNEGVNPQILEHNERVPGEPSQSNQNQYRQYLGVSTQGKVFGDIFDNSEITDDVIERSPNKFFPKEILYTANDIEVELGLKRIGEVKQEGYRIVQLRGLPRLRIALNRGVLMANTRNSILQIAEQVAFDMGRQLTIISAYRTPAQNKLARGAKQSQHMDGNALDVSTIGMTNAEKVEYVRLCIAYGAQAFGFYESDGFIHYDLGTKRHWGSIPNRYVSVLRAGDISPYRS